MATSESSFNSSSQISQGSTITGGGNVSLKTTEGDLRIVQGNIKAGDTLSVESARDLVLEAGNSSTTEQSNGSNAGFEVGVGASVGAQNGVYAYVQASAGSHKSNVDGSTWQNTQLASQNIVLTSFDKQIQRVQRVSNAFKQSPGIKSIFEFPSQKAADRATDILIEQNIRNITVRVAP